MTRFVFHFSVDLTDPRCVSVEAGALYTQGAEFVSFVWLYDRPPDTGNSFLREMIATFPEVVRLIVKEGWPEALARDPDLSFEDFVCKSFRYDNLFISRVDPIVFPPILLTDWHNARLAMRDGKGIHHVISIGADESETPPELATCRARKLRLHFDDIEREYTLSGYRGATLEDATQLVRFCEGVRDAWERETVLVHCAAGVSRSSAATLILLAVLLGRGHEAKAVARLLAVAKETCLAGLRDTMEELRPNRRLVWLGDQVLGREGALLAACVDGLDCYGRSEWSP